MNYTQTAQLLALASGFDNRMVTEAVCKLWFEILGGLDYDAAVSAMYAHFRESTDYLMPAHIVARIRHETPLTAVTMSPEAPEACAPGDHRWLPDGTCLFCEARRAQPVARGVKSAPRPDNFDAMVAAWNDPVKWAAEVARYNDQLQAAGYAPVNARLRGESHSA